MKPNTSASNLLNETNVAASLAVLARLHTEGATTGHEEKSQMTNSSSLMGTINAYRHALKDFNRNAPDDNEGAEAYADVSYGPYLERLTSWDQPATTHVEAMEALRLSLADADGVYGCPAAQKMVAAALGYLAVSGTASTSNVVDAVNKHRDALTAANEHWSKVFAVEDTIEGRIPLVRVRIGTRYRMDSEGTPVWAYDEEEVIKLTEGHIRGALNERQRASFESVREQKLAEIRTLAAERHSVRDEVGLNEMEATGRMLDQAHRKLFEELKAAKPDTLEEARIKIAYIADHLDEMGEAMDEDEAFALIRSLV